MRHGDGGAEADVVAWNGAVSDGGSLVLEVGKTPLLLRMLSDCIAEKEMARVIFAPQN